MYKINGNDYFKLRALGKAPDLNVGWSKDKDMYIKGRKSSQGTMALFAQLFEGRQAGAEQQPGRAQH